MAAVLTLEPAAAGAPLPPLASPRLTADDAAGPASALAGDSVQASAPPGDALPPIPKPRPTWFSKYGGIVVPVVLFLAVGLAVMMLDVWRTVQDDQDSAAVEVAGQMREAAHRIARTLLELDAARTAARPLRTDTLAELRGAASGFDAALHAFSEGGAGPGDDGRSVVVEAADRPQARALVTRIRAQWRPYAARLAPLRGGAFTERDVADALAYSQTSHSALINASNDFFSDMASTANSRDDMMRMLQTGGMVLTMLSASVMLLKVLRRLQLSDAAVALAIRENREILAVLREGVFVLMPDMRIGPQVSLAAHNLFRRKLSVGSSFFTLLQPMVSERLLTDTRGYLKLLFTANVADALVHGMNPLGDVEVATRGRLGLEARRHLSLQFHRIRKDGEVHRVLVTVQDATARVELEARLRSEQARSHKELAMLLKAIDAEPAQLRQFVARAERSLLEINDVLRSSAPNENPAPVVRRIDQAARRLDAVKGEAAALGLDTVSNQAHQMEAELRRLLQSGGPSAELCAGLAALGRPLEALLVRIGALKSLSALQRPALDDAAGDTINDLLAELVDSTAAATGKRVRASVRMGAASDMDEETAALLREIAVQLVRNAVVHGIEAPQARLAAGKPEDGRLDVQLTRGESEWTLSVRDDGAGLVAAPIRARLLALGWYTAAQLASFDDRQVVGHIFKPGFSTAQAVTPHAGRGVGLDVVQADVQKLGARMTLSSTPGQFTEFKIRLG